MSRVSKRALVVRQWLKKWDELSFPESEQRAKPDARILLFGMSAQRLRALSGVYRRERTVERSEGIQRYHEDARSRKIRDFVENGYPYCELSARKREQADFADHKKPGWLPTSIVINIIPAGAKRPSGALLPSDSVSVDFGDQDAELATLSLPENSDVKGWKPHGLPPFEIIDGQHRLFAFDDDVDGDFELPVVAFVGLDLGWQAYLFWSINVSPKKINPSHAFDLYPLLRTQQWLEKFSESYVYREARAQELTEVLYRHRRSSWQGRINMLGERKGGGVSQAGWIRSLYSTFLSSRRGLFGSVIGYLDAPLQWSRAQQAAVLIFLWNSVRSAVLSSSAEWIVVFGEDKELAFSGNETLLNQEQGVRGMLAAANELLVENAEALKLDEWRPGLSYTGETDDEDIDEALAGLEKVPAAKFIIELANAAVTFDWRSVGAPGVSPEEALKKRALRGSGGYTIVRNLLLDHLASQEWQGTSLATTLNKSA